MTGRRRPENEAPWSTSGSSYPYWIGCRARSFRKTCTSATATQACQSGAVFETSLRFDECMTRRSRRRWHCGRTSRMSAAGVGVVVVAATLAGCTSGDHVSTPPAAITSAATPEVPPATASAPPCTGADGRATLTAMLADLSHGKHVDVGTYFVPPIQFVRWLDPSAYVTFLPGADGSVTLDALQAHLNDLERRHVRATLINFDDGGYGYVGGPATNDQGGWFTFTLHGRASATASPQDGLGKGAIDCTSKKIKVFVIDGW